MANTKIKTLFHCVHCDAQYPKWLGQCAGCGKWGSLEQETVIANPQKDAMNSLPRIGSIDLSGLAENQARREKIDMEEFDRVLGGGIVSGSMILLGGDPGIGKSTLVAQVLGKLAQSGKQCLYVSGEESAEQVKMRLARLDVLLPLVRFLSETTIEQIISTARAEKPFLLVVDSVQTMQSLEAQSEAGSITQVRACTVKLLECAKKDGIAVILIGHVTKDGAVAGPRTLEHLVDVVLYLEGDPQYGYRLLRGVKNRFGSTSEVGVFEMTSQGLLEVKNPTEIFLSQHKSLNVSGSVITMAMEGVRPFLVEIQALVTRTHFGYPKRAASGFDANRLQLLLAVLERRGGINLANYDVFVNVIGGYKIKEPAADLAVVVAIVSAFQNVSFGKPIVVFGEVGLGGEVRQVIHSDKRISEATKLGFEVMHHESVSAVTQLSDHIK